MLLFRSYKLQSILTLWVWMMGILFDAKVIMSIVMFAVAVLMVFEWDKLASFPLKIRSTLGASFRLFIKDKGALAVAIPFLLVLGSALYSTEDSHYLLQRLRIKLPFLVLPLCFFAMPRFGRGSQYITWSGMIGLTVVACFVTLANYLLHFEAIHTMIGQGKSIPCPTNHIRFSLMIAFMIIVSAKLVYDGYYLYYKQERYVLTGVAIFLFLFLHILAVRSGLVVFYATALILLFRYVVLNKRYLLGLGVLVFMLLIPMLAYKFVPSFQQKQNYASWDYKMFRSGKGVSYSDSERLISLNAGIHVSNNSPWIGVGAGDLKYEIKEYYNKYMPNLPMESRKMPHNQLVTIYAGVGLLGLLIFLLGFSFQLFHKKRYKNQIYLALHLIIFGSYLVENTIESAVGVAFYLLFVLWIMRFEAD